MIRILLLRLLAVAALAPVFVLAAILGALVVLLGFERETET